jgi:CPA2 family monovalent cation:H+ antiporter-2
MLLDLNYLMQNPVYIVLIALGVIVLKALIAGFAVSLMGLSLRIAVLIGLALSQIGEFSFILSSVGFESGLIPLPTYQLFLDVTVITMGATSFIMALSPRVADGYCACPPEQLKAGDTLGDRRRHDCRRRCKDHQLSCCHQRRSLAKSAEPKGYLRHR